MNLQRIPFTKNADKVSLSAAEDENGRFKIRAGDRSAQPALERLTVAGAKIPVEQPGVAIRGADGFGNSGIAPAAAGLSTILCLATQTTQTLVETRPRAVCFKSFGRAIPPAAQAAPNCCAAGGTAAGAGRQRLEGASRGRECGGIMSLWT